MNTHESRLPKDPAIARLIAMVAGGSTGSETNRSNAPPPADAAPAATWPAVTGPGGSAEPAGTTQTALEKALALFASRIVSVAHTRQTIVVRWVSGTEDEARYSRILRLIEQGRQAEAALIMELLLAIEPDDTSILYNLGMIYSDAGLIGRAIDLLKRLITLDDAHANGLVALGVAYTRADRLDDALYRLRKATQIEPDNPWAQRNLGAVYARKGNHRKAIDALSRAVEHNPDDDRAWFGLAQALERTGNHDKAIEAYHRVIAINEYGDMAESARTAISKMAQDEFRSPSVPRIDAVMYLLAAIEKFATKSEDEVKAIGIEIAMLGMKGISINDPDSRYTIRSLPGEFSGLSLVCHEYVAFKRFAPDADIGIDLSAEYEAALGMYGGEGR